ncbi:hypothetical protein F5Y14DRAFT_204621 [Nemania sp. NC0429]|nr:hypothetical protein F5Y14DRAFT_204621 [Nemania sp. NC0429]
MRSRQAIITLGVVVHGARAVYVAHNSPCLASCGNVPQGTSLDQIVCDDADYGTTTGKVFQSCVACESTSSYVTTSGDRPESDLQAMLFNMRYATAQCLFHTEMGPCSTSQACLRLQKSLEYGNFSSSVSPYGYCSLWSDFDLFKCTQCLPPDGKGYIRNFVSILSGACDLQQLQLQPPPATLPLTGDVFSEEQVNVTNPTSTASVRVHNSVGPLSTGALAGIVIGGIVLLLILLGCGVVINGKRRRKNYLRRRGEQTKNWPSPQAAGDMFETPISQRPLRGGGWGDSPISAATPESSTAYPPYPRYFSPYTTQFDSPVSAVEGHGSPMAWPVEKAQSIGLALSPDRDVVESPWSSDRKGKEKAAGVDTEGYELQEGVNSAGGYGHPAPAPPHVFAEAPVLNHPGYGRQGQASPPRQTPSPL